ncbi:hypothetical protein IKF34_00275 [Candidatus Saccharibacteria bacterium]|nr:hypothetical protein [Candidatus Saccharibacteria bacterium]
MKNNYKLIIPKELIKEIDLKEISAAEILMEYFKTDISFIRRSNHKTPDFEINGLRWELKSPTGSGKHNIQHNMQDAALQSENIIIDGRKSKIHPIRLRNEAKYQFEIIKSLKRVLIITKSKKVLEINRKK